MGVQWVLCGILSGHIYVDKVDFDRVWCAQIAEKNAPSVFDVNKEPAPEPAKKPPEPEIVSKWTLVDYDNEEAPMPEECVDTPCNVLSKCALQDTAG